MGRRTWDSLPARFRPAAGTGATSSSPATRPGRQTAPSGRRRSRTRSGCSTARRSVFVIGGAQLYAAALPLADELLLTEIELDVEGDTFFPRSTATLVRGGEPRAARVGDRSPVRVRDATSGGATA